MVRRLFTPLVGRYVDRAALSDLNNVKNMRNAELYAKDEALRALQQETDVLSDQVKYLKMQVDVLQKAYGVNSSELLTAKSEAEMLQSELDSIKNDAPLIIALIDGDGTVFNESYLTNGRDGGREAARVLREHIIEASGADARRAGHRIMVQVYVNRAGLCRQLLRSNICNAIDFGLFCEGFTQSSNLFCFIDVGEGKDAADGKIRDTLSMFIAMPQVARVFVGGTHDGGYCLPLSQLDGVGKFADKVTLVRGIEKVAFDYKKLPLDMQTRMVVWEDLFRKQALENIGSPRIVDAVVQPVSRTGPPPTSFAAAIAANAPAFPPGLPISAKAVAASLKSPSSPTPGANTRGTARPCHNYHLLDGACLYGSACHFWHGPITKKEREDMAAYIKSLPCEYINNDANCPQGDKCIYAHKCRYGRMCDRRSTCKFVGDEMHSL
ncbi:hypothetical protein BKA62DRAFT_184200 [Auriculariales sp. MPI-PUGE-AT-0066]|nr:hypothetical protein BKA62DRAFT_184200 [Auriculariales sp. MPI-PUGE-AT-0066]